MIVTRISTKEEHYPTASDYDGTPLTTQILEVEAGDLVAEKGSDRFVITSFKLESYNGDRIQVHGKPLNKKGLIKSAYEQYLGAIRLPLV